MPPPPLFQVFIVRTPHFYTKLRINSPPYFEFTSSTYIDSVSTLDSLCRVNLAILIIIEQLRASYSLAAVAEYTCSSTTVIIAILNCHQLSVALLTSLTQPTYLDGECGFPPDFANGQVLFTSTDEGSIATYICHDGYTLEGSSTRTCSNGNWSDSTPFCQGICIVE